MKTIPRSMLVVGLGASLVLMTWMLARDETGAEPIRSLEAAASTPDASASELPAFSDAGSETRGIAAAASEGQTVSEGTALDPDSASIELRLADAAGAPARGGEAWFGYSWDSDPSDAFPFPLDVPSESSAEIVKDEGLHVAGGEDGLIRLTGIQAGRDLVLHVGGPHWNGSSRRIAPLGPAEHRQLGTISVFHASRIHGRVLDTEDRPLAHASVELRARDGRAAGSDAPDDQLRTDSGEDGSFDFAGLLPGVYSLRGSAPGLGIALIDSLLIPEGGEDVSVELRLPPGIPLHGRILDETLHPLTSAKVQLTDGQPLVEDILEYGTAVDEEGRFELGVPAEIGLNRLVAAAPGYAAGSAELLASGHAIELVLEPVATVTGRIVDASGVPVAGALLRLQSFPNEPRLTSSAADGSFEYAGVTPGTHRIEASAPCGSAAIPSLLVYPGLDPLQLTLVGESGVLVTVLGPDSGPLQGATVELFPEQAWEEGVERAAREASASPPAPDADGEEIPPAEEQVVETLDALASDGELSLTSSHEAQFLVALPRRGLTDERGRVLLLGIPSGTWEVQASVEGFLDGTLYFERSADAVEELTLRLQRSSQLRVQVVGPAGEPVPHTDMALMREEQSPEDEEAGVLFGARTDANGLAVWRRPPPGDYTLQVQVAPPSRHAEYSAGSLSSSETVRVHLEPGATVEERFVLRSLCLPSVRVTRRGVPVPGAQVEVYPGELRPEEALLSSFESVRRAGIATEASGKVALRACLPGVHTLAASPPSGSPATLRQVDLKPGAQLIEIELAEGQIAGRVEGPGGSIAGVQITLLPALEPTHARGADSDGGEESATPSEDGPGCTTGSDRAGAFLIDNVPSGRYLLRVQAPHFTPWLSEPFEHDGRRSMDLGKILLTGAGALTGSVLGSTPGTGDHSQWVRAEADGGFGSSLAPLGASGRFAFDSLPPGGYRLSVFMRGNWVGSEPVEVHSNQRTSLDWFPR